MASGCVAPTARSPACRRRDRARLEVFRRVRRGRAWRSYSAAVLVSYQGHPWLARPPIDQVLLTSKHKVAQSISADLTAGVAAGDVEEADIVTDQVLLSSKHKVAQSISADVTVDVAVSEIEEADTVADQVLLTSQHKVAQNISADATADMSSTALVAGGVAHQVSHLWSGPTSCADAGRLPSAKAVAGSYLSRLRLVTDCSGLETPSLAFELLGIPCTLVSAS